MAGKGNCGGRYSGRRKWLWSARLACGAAAGSQIVAGSDISMQVRQWRLFNRAKDYDDFTLSNWRYIGDVL